MGFLARQRQKRRAGQTYFGPATFSDDYSLVPRPGFYALTADGRTVLRDAPLVSVDDAPGDDENGACHYEYAGPNDGPYARAATVIPLEAHDAIGRGDTAA